MPSWFFVMELSYLVLLLGGAVAFARWPILDRALPHRIGAVPLPVAWWGALGGTMISLEGVFLHNRDWDPAYNYWHIARPLIGAALGTVAYLIFVAVVDATGAKAKTQGSLAYYIVAFLVGYREETFRNLIKRATDVLIGPGHSPKPGGPASDEDC
jgi:hypothetical protein